MKKQLLLHEFGIKFSFYEGCTDYLIVLAKNEKQAAAKAKKWLEKNMLTDDWDIEEIVMNY